MKDQASLILILSLALVWCGDTVAEIAPLPDAPIEIEGWDKASEKAQSALKAYYEARRNQPKGAAAGVIPPRASVRRAPAPRTLPITPGAEEPEQVSTIKELQDRGDRRSPIAPTRGTTDKDLGEKPDPLVERKEVGGARYRDLSQYFINRGGGVQYSERGNASSRDGYFNLKQIERSQIDQISPYSSRARQQASRSTQRRHASRTEPEERTRGSNR